MKVIEFLTIVFSAGMVLGCATPKMVVPADVLSMQADEIVATERKNASGAFVNESFKLGPYSIEDVDRDWDSTKSVGISSFSSEKTTSGYSYIFKMASGEMKGSCLIEGKEKGISMFGGVSMAKSVSKFGCSCEANGATATVVLDSKNDSKYEGTMTTQGGEYSIAAIYEAEGSLSTGNPSGYRVDGDSVVAAVDVMHPGKIWLGKDLVAGEKDELACVFTGLMLYQGKKD